MDLALLLDTSIILSTKEHIVEPKPTAVDLKLQLQSFYFNQKNRRLWISINQNKVHLWFAIKKKDADCCGGSKDSKNAVTENTPS